MSIADKLHSRITKYQEIFGKEKSPEILLLTKEELEELFKTTDKPREQLIYELAQLGMHAQMIYPEEISAILQILTTEQLTLLLTHPKNTVRDLAMQELKIRKQKQNNKES